MNDLPSAKPLEITGAQKALYDLLAERHAPLATMYLGALTSIEAVDNPDRVALAAHGVRELMEKIPEYLEIDMPAHRESLRDKVNVLETQWVEIETLIPLDTDGRFEGPLDPRIGRLLLAIKMFFAWYREFLPRRREEVARFLQRLDGTQQRLPEPANKFNLTFWQGTRDFFNNVAHHRKLVTVDALNSRLRELESFILDRLNPRTFADIDEIDAIIGKGQGHADT